MTKEVMELALEALKTNNKEWKSLADSGDAGYWKAEDQDHYQLTEKSIKVLEEALKQEQYEPKCKTHPDAPHGFVRNASHSEDRYVCECEFWEPPEQDEPVVMRYDFDGYGYKYIDSGSGSDWQTRERGAEPLYTAPQQRKPLTRKDIDRLHEEDCFSGNIYEITAEIEAAHGIKE